MHEIHSYFIYCVKDLILKGNSSQWFSCLRKKEFSVIPIMNCISSGLRPKLELQYANASIALIPSHQYVPWVTVNKVPLYDISSLNFWSNYDNFVKAVSNAYKCTSPPIFCSKPTTDIDNEAKSNSNQ
ncbi:hypothetical protein MKX03_001265 [Papaver bracteatum]|nr:hypothetical protein MKX03_001265 [Papaver bracteatum]